MSYRVANFTYLMLAQAYGQRRGLSRSPTKTKKVVVARLLALLKLTLSTAVLVIVEIGIQ